MTLSSHNPPADLPCDFLQSLTLFVLYAHCIPKVRCLILAGTEAQFVESQFLCILFGYRNVDPLRLGHDFPSERKQLPQISFSIELFHSYFMFLDFDTAPRPPWIFEKSG